MPLKTFPQDSKVEFILDCKLFFNTHDLKKTDMRQSDKKTLAIEYEFSLRVRTVAKRHMRSSMFTASFILVSCVKLP